MRRKFKNRKDDEKMCNKLKELQFKKPDDFSKDILVPSVDIFQILETVGVRCFRTDFNRLLEKLPSKDTNISCLTYASGNDLFILYSYESDLPTARFTLAHELAHCCLHIDPDTMFHIEMQSSPDIVHDQRGISRVISDKKEKEADRFARELLIPTRMFAHVLQTMKEFSIEELAALFLVPQEEIINKIIDLKEKIQSRDSIKEGRV